MTNSVNCVPIAFIRILVFGGGCILLLTSYRSCVKTTSILESRSGRNMWQACNLFLAKKIPTKCTTIKAFTATTCKINQKDTTIHRSEKTQSTFWKKTQVDNQSPTLSDAKSPQKRRFLPPISTVLWTATLIQPWTNWLSDKLTTWRTD